MTTEHLVTYLRLPRDVDGRTPSAEFLARLARGGRGPVIVQRWLLDAPLPLPPAPAECDSPPVEEAWVTDLEGLRRVLEAGGGADVGRLVVRLSWPLTPIDEATVLLARLQHAGLRLAIRLPPSAAEEVFYYLDCLGLPWLALHEPEGTIAAWLQAMRRLLRLWLFEPRSCTPMEPILSAFRMFCLSLRARVRWRFQIVDCPQTGPAVVSQQSRPWTPSVHTALVAGGNASIDPAVDDWIHDLPRLYAGLDRDTLASLAPPVAAAREGLSGGWGGPWTIGAYSGTVDAELVQRGSALTGHGVANGHPGVSSIRISGVVQGDQASGTLTAPGLADMPFHVTITGSRMEGSLGQGRVSLQRQ